MMLRRSNASLLAAVLTLVSAPLLGGCGDDSATGGSGGTPSNGGQGGAGGEGGQPTTNSPITVTNSTSSGMMPMAPIGEPCTSDAECGDGVCITEDPNGFPTGYCTIECEDDRNCNGNTCMINLETPLCAKSCDAPRDCREGYECTVTALALDPICFPACTADDQCAATNHCVVEPTDPFLGMCKFPEVCDDAQDNEPDNYFNCSDPECLADAGCIAEIADVCAGAVALAPTQTGTTDGGSNTFTIFCGLVTGIGPEQLYQFTAPAAGELSLAADPGTDVDLALYVRSDCTDVTTQLACADDPQDGTVTEQVAVGLTAGQTVTVFVDAYAPDYSGSYTLTSSFENAVCGDGNITLPEQCDDGNPTAGDGCSDTCQIEYDFYCNSAIPVTLGTTSGDTSDGSSLFDAPVDALTCQAGAGTAGNEVLYVYTPTSNGTLTVQVEPTDDFDVGVYVRTTCADGATQIGCADVNFQAGTQQESLSVPVVANQPVTIFVDAYQAAGGAFSLTLSQN
ncbi:MAG: hypothetical protein HOW73_19980 [Polyangiaceae bacterium]|nr:hypothetical protein [Polyangiaceae bacterium]